MVNEGTDSRPQMRNGIHVLAALTTAGKGGLFGLKCLVGRLKEVEGLERHYDSEQRGARVNRILLDLVQFSPLSCTHG